jgi:plasmid stabilization system protein ParE
MKLRLRSVAEADAAEAIRGYADQKPDLGARLFEALASTLRSIEHNPKLYPVVDGEMRRALFPKPFPTWCSTGSKVT